MDGYGRVVLVVDDDHHTRFLIGAMLARQGYNVVPACNGVSALGELSKRHFDLVITDDRMPQLSGLDFLKQVLARHPRVPVIFAATEVQEHAFTHDCHPFAWIRKPYDETELLAVVRLATQAKVECSRLTLQYRRGVSDASEEDKCRSFTQPIAAPAARSG